VDTAAEGDMGGRGPAYVEIVRVRETVRVAVSGAECEHHGLTTRNSGTAHSPGPCREPAGGEDLRAVVPQDFLNGSVQERPIGPQRCELVRVVEQGQHAVGYEVGGG
jgi:hypothetical protein